MRPHGARHPRAVPATRARDQHNVGTHTALQAPRHISTRCITTAWRYLETRSTEDAAACKHLLSPLRTGEHNSRKHRLSGVSWLVLFRDGRGPCNESRGGRRGSLQTSHTTAEKRSSYTHRHEKRLVLILIIIVSRVQRRWLRGTSDVQLHPHGDRPGQAAQAPAGQPRRRHNAAAGRLRLCPRPSPRLARASRALDSGC